MESDRFSSATILSKNSLVLAAVWIAMRITSSNSVIYIVVFFRASPFC